MESILRDKVRPVTETDRTNLPMFSYSKMEVFKNCPYQYNLKYNEKKYSKDTTLALELGSLCHYILEQKGKMLLSDQSNIDYKKLNRIKDNGVIENKTELLGVKALKKKYFDDWYEPDNASGMTYKEKMEVFDKVLHSEMEEDTDGWKPLLFEHPFEFVWDDRIIVHGFIDRIDIKKGAEIHYKTIDYKTSKKVYDKSKLATSLQFGVYALAILNEFNCLPEESEYRFILIDERQKALTKGWEKRLVKALTNLLDKIQECDETAGYKPSPCPLCYWCNYSGTNPNAYSYKDECGYYSLWTPTNKTFSTNREWEGNIKASGKPKERKLIF